MFVNKALKSKIERETQSVWEEDWGGEGMGVGGGESERNSSWKLKNR